MDQHIQMRGSRLLAEISCVENENSRVEFLLFTVEFQTTSIGRESWISIFFTSNCDGAYGLLQ